MRIALACGVCVSLMMAAAASAQDDGGNVDPAPSGHEETVIDVDTTTGVQVITPGEDAGDDPTNLNFDDGWEGADAHPDDTTVIYDGASESGGDTGGDDTGGDADTGADSDAGSDAGSDSGE